MIAYVIMQPGTSDVLLNDGSWGDEALYWERAAVFSCPVRAQRRAAKYRAWHATVCPWDVPETPEYELS